MIVMKYCQETKLVCISVAPSEERGNGVEGGGWKIVRDCRTPNETTESKQNVLARAITGSRSSRLRSILLIIFSILFLF